MFELHVKMEFPAAHYLRGYPGDCARLHGHNWGVEVFVCSDSLDSLGMGVDFRTIKQALREVIARWDHQELNELPEFQSVNPTAEQIAKITYERLSNYLIKMLQTEKRKIWVDRVTIWENSSYAATYRRIESA